MAVRRVTAPVQEKLNRLAGILYAFLPLTSRSANAITLTSIFAQSSVAGYLEGKSNKRQALQAGVTELYRRHPRLPRSIIRKIVPAAIEYRTFRRDPLRRDEVTALSECLFDLGIDMRRELQDLRLDETLPRITVPPDKLKTALREHDLEPEVASEPLELFQDGHFNEAVRKASERFEDLVHEICGVNASGRDLMARAFGSSTYLRTDRLQPENEESFSEGFKFLAMGMMAAIRNVFSHGDEERRPPEECFEMLLFLNWMFRTVDRGKVSE